MAMDYLVYLVTRHILSDTSFSVGHTSILYFFLIIPFGTTGKTMGEASMYLKIP